MLGNKTIFVTKKSEGSLKGVLIVECIEINGGQFKGKITLSEAREKIFIEKLGLPANLLHSFKMNFGKFRSVSFKLNEQIDVDDLADKESFEFSHMNFQQNFNDRNNYVQINDVSRLLIGRNNTMNKLKCLNNSIDFDWLNQSLNTFKIKSKKQFLT